MLANQRLPQLIDVEAVFHSLPPGKTPVDKFVFALQIGSEIGGCVDLIRGYPEPLTAFPGLLLLTEPFQGCGYGPQVLAALETLARRWDARKLRLAVLPDNLRAEAFWRRQGFQTIVPQPCLNTKRQVCVLEKALKAD